MKYLGKIENYLNDNLSSEERTSFDEECEINQELAEELVFYLQIHQAFNETKRAAFNQRYQAAKANNTIPKIQSNRNRFYIRMAASAAVIAILIWFGMPMFNDYQIDSQLAVNGEPIFFLDEQTVRGENEEQLLSEAFTAIDNKDYNEVFRLVDTIAIKEAIGIKSFAYFELEDYTNAVKYYELYLEKETKYFERLRAQWNLSLAYRKLGNTEAEEKILEAIGEKGKKDILKILKQ